MKNIVHFLDLLFEAEINCHCEYRKENNMDAFNKALDELEAFTINDSESIKAKISFGFRSMTEEHEEVFLEDVIAFLPPIGKRFLYKISVYKHPKYGTMYACYVSLANPKDGKKIRLLSRCFIVASVGEALKVIAQYFPDYDTGQWKIGGGDWELRDFSNLGNFMEAHRFMSPLNDAWSIGEYESKK